MSIHIETRTLVDALDLAARVVERRNTVPILNGLLISADLDGFKFVGTDLDMRVEVLAPNLTADEQTAGTLAPVVLCSHREVSRSLRMAGEKMTTITVKSGSSKIEFKSGSLRIRSETLPAVDYPGKPRMVDTPTFTATIGSEFIGALGRVSGAVSTEETRYYLNGVYIEKDTSPWGYIMVATDGHRLYSAGFAMPDATGELEKTIFPSKPVRLLREIAAKGAGLPITFSQGPSRGSTNSTALLSFDAQVPGQELRVHIVTKTIDGTFPDWRRVVPDKSPHMVTFEPQVIRRAIHGVMAGVVTKKTGHGHSRCIKLGFNKSRVTVASQWLGGADYDDASMEIDGRADATLDKFEIGFNGGYVLQMLDALGPVDEITLAFAGQGMGGKEDKASGHDPVVVVAPGLDSFKGLLMPMRA